MPINKELFLRESFNLENKLNEGVYFGQEGDNDRAIGCFDDMIVSAGLLLTKDPEIGKLLKFDKLVLVGKGYQLKAYMQKLKAEKDEDERKSIVKEATRVANGPVSLDNPYFKQIYRALTEYDKAQRGGRNYITGRPKPPR